MTMSSATAATTVGATAAAVAARRFCRRRCVRLQIEFAVHRAASAGAGHGNEVVEGLPHQGAFAEAVRKASREGRQWQRGQRIRREARQEFGWSAQTEDTTAVAAVVIVAVG